MITAIDTQTGKTALIPAWIIDHPVFNPGGRLVAVKPGTKPFVGAYKPKTADEFSAVHPEKVLDSEELEIDDTPEEED